MLSLNPARTRARPEKPGPIYNSANYRNFLTDEILELVADETNRYAQQFISTHQLRRSLLMRNWKGTNAKEMEKFFGIIIIMGIVQLPQLRLYWPKDPMYRNELIVRSMTRNRFDLLLKCLHFCNNDDIDDNTKKLFKVKKVINLAIAQFIQAANPGKDVVIDETRFHGEEDYRFVNIFQEKLINME